MWKLLFIYPWPLFLRDLKALRTVGDAGLHWNIPRRLFLVLEKGVLDWGNFTETREFLMALAPAITDLEQFEESSGGRAPSGMEL